jgi:cyclohexyl-isocyanide hydratase
VERAAGVDFALTVLSELAGPVVAQAVQLGLEYDPKPPLTGGSPTRAAAEVKTAVDQRYVPRLPEFERLLDRVASRLHSAA